jgi:hypothetical protein
MVVHETHRFVNVIPYSDTLGGMNNKPIISAALAYDEPMTGEVVILIIIIITHRFSLRELAVTALIRLQVPAERV